jgi:8-oxo-dGTP diphosphatase
MEHPKIGVAVIIHDGNGRVLMGLRQKSGPGNGKWQFPGGHLEMYESLDACAARETREEVDIEIENISFLDLSNNPWPEHGKHYVTLFMLAQLKSGVPKGVESYCTDWTWFHVNSLPPANELFESVTILTEDNKNRIRSGR